MSEIKKNTGDPSTLENLQAIQDWQLAWSRLVAYAWENWNARISVNGVIERNVVDLIIENPHHYLSQFGYDSSFDTSKVIIVKEQNEGETKIKLNSWKVKSQQEYQPNQILPPSSVTCSQKNGWHEAHKNNQLSGAIVVVLPTPPETDQAMALSDYMAISNYQPYTCT